MKILRTRKTLCQWRKRLKSKANLGFVPTMGALHKGHLSLIKDSKKQNHKTIVSIFVNPTQFNDPKDLDRYPRTEKEDLKKLKKLNVDAVFLPKDIQEIYPEGGDIQIIPHCKWSAILEGQHRPGHFVGVATVVLKLFHLVQPNRAYFGEKDFQQVRIIEQMVKDLFLEVKIKRGKTVREKNGLAMSSRNQFLSPENFKKAAVLHRALQKSKNLEKAKSQIEAEGLYVDYLEEWEGRWLVAARAGKVRLIDNVCKSIDRKN